MKKIVGIVAISLLLLSCGNKGKQEYSPTMIESQSEVSYQQPDTAVAEEVTVEQEEVKAPSTHTSSVLPHTHKSSCYDNMRGFDPASENDMDDNGMSRYMENNDEEGWD